MATESNPRKFRRWWFAVGALLLFYGGVLESWREDRAAEKVFQSMTPVQHIDAAKNDLDILPIHAAIRKTLIADGLRHARAVPPESPEAANAREIEASLMVADERLQAERNEQAEQRQVRQSFPATLQNELTNLGYDCSVTFSPSAPDEIVITSTDFSETDRRVRFLAFLRGRNYYICMPGFRKVRLKAGRFTPLAFSESYDLGCLDPK